MHEVHAGVPLGPTQAQLAPSILDKPNEFAVLVSFMKQPQRLAAYLRDQCTTSEVTGAAFPLYDEFLLVRAPPAAGAAFVVCRDNFLAMEQHVRSAPPSLHCRVRPLCCMPRAA